MSMLDSAQNRVNGTKFDLGSVVIPEVVKDTTWDFLKAPRFYAMLLGALSIYGKQKGWLGEPEMQFIATVATLFVGIRTIDRTVEKLS